MYSAAPVHLCSGRVWSQSCSFIMLVTLSCSIFCAPVLWTCVVSVMFIHNASDLSCSIFFLGVKY
jgi:hypothetical protein